MDYFALKNDNDLGNNLVKKVNDYFEHLRESGLLAELKESQRLYFGNSNIRSGGSLGELKKINVNHYANLIRHLLVMVTSNRPAWEPRAANTDHKSQAQTVLAAGLLDHYMREKRLERILKKAAEYSLYLREGWVSPTWDVTGGEVYAIDEESGQQIKEGDIRYKAHNLFEVIRDINRRSLSDLPWLIIKEQRNKFDLVVKYPHLSENIKRNPAFDDTDRVVFGSNIKDDGEDTVNVYTFYHEKSDVLPQGRLVEFLIDGTVLFDGPLPYRKIPAYKITSGDLDNTPFGHSPTFDLIPIQKALDSEFSTVITNHNAFGVQNLAVPKGSGVTVNQVSGGLNLIEYDAKLGVPQPLNLVQTPAEIFNSINLLTQVAETISGVNSIARGNAPASLSGAAMALIQSTSLQFASNLQASYTALIEDIGTATVHLLQDFAVVPRIAALVGKHNRSLLREFKGQDIDQISRVTVDSANALTKSTAGRVEIANQLLNAGLIKRPEQYMMVLQTGKLEPMLESDTSQLLRVRAENEKLSQGEMVKAIISDDHSLDVREHLSILDTPEARDNAQITEIVLAHVFEHIELAKKLPPELAKILGREPIVQTQAVNPANLQAPADIDPASGVSLPSMPKIAGTNETFNPNGQE